MKLVVEAIIMTIATKWFVAIGKILYRNKIFCCNRKNLISQISPLQPHQFPSPTSLKKKKNVLVLNSLISKLHNTAKWHSCSTKPPSLHNSDLTLRYALHLFSISLCHCFNHLTLSFSLPLSPENRGRSLSLSCAVLTTSNLGLARKS